MAAASVGCVPFVKLVHLVQMFSVFALRGHASRVVRSRSSSRRAALGASAVLAVDRGGIACSYGDPPVAGFPQDLRMSTNRKRVEWLALSRLRELAGSGTEPVELAALHAAMRDVTVAATEELVDVTRAAFGKVTLSTRITDLRELAEEAVDDAASLFSARSQSIALLVGSAPIWSRVDPSRMAQVIANLLDNASMYTPRGGRIVVCVEETPDEATVRVRDNGTGIAADALERIFEPFERQPGLHDGELEIGRKLGVGLTVVRSLVRLHGGDVRAFSGGPGLGAELVVSLPGLPAAGVGAVRAEPDARRPLGPGRGRGEPERSGRAFGFGAPSMA
jgi:signal transduction histidine kinase